MSFKLGYIGLVLLLLGYVFQFVYCKPMIDARSQEKSVKDHFMKASAVY